MIITLFNLEFGSSTMVEFLTIETENHCGSLFGMGWDRDSGAFFLDVFFISLF